MSTPDAAHEQPPFDFAEVVPACHGQWSMVLHCSRECLAHTGRSRAAQGLPSAEELAVGMFTSLLRAEHKVAS